MVKKLFILAGGFGTRLRPITYEIPKPLVPVQGKPILTHTIEFFKKFGVTEIIMSIGFLGEKIMDYYGDGSKFGVKIQYITEDEPAGTAGPLRLIKHLINDEDFFMINGDNLFNLDLNNMIKQHKNTGCIASLALTPVDDPTSFGVAKLNENKILEFIEKPKIENAPSNLINAGVYLFNSKIFNYIPDKTYSKIETEVFPELAKKGELFAYLMQGQWLPVGTMQEYETAIKDWKGNNC
jgi:NDP-sugar pyrophosphorylase family protein